MTGAGDLIQDSLGRWIKGYRMNLGIKTSLIAELKALQQGLILARDCHMQRLIVELDAKLIIGWVWGNSPNVAITNLIVNHGMLCQEFEAVLPKHAYREANKCTNHLANVGTNMNEYSVT
ncbi:uncharacterized protein LOC116214484 [Punica granatum]|uniref:Uncharacterized protein LOC116214484 n=1 Tax=Punica granatum TaxID=22663 RepID=A0A6P8EK93_PUNGR|nr:uncharacterized protein LOC116214484 [Punica granatum]